MKEKQTFNKYEIKILQGTIIIRVIKLGRVGWVGNVARKGHERCIQNFGQKA
jgi:hypothetical protein